MRRVVVTGLGLVTPLAPGVEGSWEAIRAGRSGAGFITRFDPESWRVKIAAEVPDWDPTQHMSAREARRLDRYQQMALVAAREALANSGLEIDESNAERSGVIVGVRRWRCRELLQSGGTAVKHGRSAAHHTLWHPHVDGQWRQRPDQYRDGRVRTERRPHLRLRHRSRLHRTGL